uniref:Uncharacterized protein n=1 Tax=Malurus cyaneus samueli TaxID=2593467 RepID=A0A8C5ULJ3_9PASS
MFWDEELWPCGAHAEVVFVIPPQNSTFSLCSLSGCAAGRCGLRTRFGRVHLGSQAHTRNSHSFPALMEFLLQVKNATNQIVMNCADIDIITASYAPEGDEGKNHTGSESQNSLSRCCHHCIVFMVKEFLWSVVPGVWAEDAALVRCWILSGYWLNLQKTRKWIKTLCVPVDLGISTKSLTGLG